MIFVRKIGLQNRKSLKRKLSDETWMEIAISSQCNFISVFSSMYKYRKQVKAQMEGENHGST
ncbi:hypothetical protein GC096_17700 [Paenibacillus sp. LMG 31461]|uniref:Uncharacterized protein n=1 Tax=Paenibacillus plantarum TaxID=2654975 RepID=A0ABX1XBP6_9BACL|nr:hypothetical protein [Paenibacillus plantarum]NOU65872.1 hypothetical protein [Paenibacillus plantarum]